MESLWQVLLRATETQEVLSCEECFVLMDYLADLLAEGYSPRSVLSLAEKYLQRCPNCQEEYRQEMAELLLVPSDRNGTPELTGPPVKYL